MSHRFTISQLDRLVKEGKIRSYTVAPKKKVKGHPSLPKSSKEKGWMHLNLLAWCQEKGYELKKEYRFHPRRLWRFDFFVPAMGIGIEYNGVFSEKSRHLTAVGHTGDTDKLNAAQAMGYKVLQYTPLNYKTVLTQLDELWNSRTK